MKLLVLLALVALATAQDGEFYNCRATEFDNHYHILLDCRPTRAPWDKG